jgi:hypothetical protein
LKIGKFLGLVVVMVPKKLETFGMKTLKIYV